MFIITHFAVIIILKEIDVFRTYNVGPISHKRKTSTYIQMQTYVTVSVEIIVINAWNKNIIMTNKVNDNMKSL